MVIQAIGSVSSAQGAEMAVQGARQAQALERPAETREGQGQPQPSRQAVEGAVKSVNAAVQARVPNLEFSIDKDTDLRVVKLVDTESKDVIRQIPSEAIIEIAKALDRLQGLLMRDKV